MSYNSIDRALENEIRIIEEDDSLTPQEKAKEISKLEREARDIYREERERDDDEREGW